MMLNLSADFLTSVASIAKRAGLAVMPLYAQTALPVTHKADGSPLTAADSLAHQWLVDGLMALTPELPYLSEEGIDNALRMTWPTYWLLDPIDGTKEFLAHNGDFTVNIALIHQQKVILGIVYAPALNTCYLAAEGLGAFKQCGDGPLLAIKARALGENLTIIASRRHGVNHYQALYDRFPHYQLLERGSSLKFCLVAEGLADLYPRLAPTSEWDTAAAQCVLEQAGGAVIDLQGLSLRYNTQLSVLNPHFIACADPSIPWLDYLRFYVPHTDC